MTYNTVTKEIAPDYRDVSPEKSDVLPKSFYFIPIIFWVLLLGILISSFVIGRIGKSKMAEAYRLQSEMSYSEREIIIVDKRIEALAERIADSDRLYNWVTKVPMIQPLLASYFSSFEDDSRVSRITVEYAEGSPGQFVFNAVYQGDATETTTLFQDVIAELAKDGWSLAQSKRTYDGNTAVIESFVRVESSSPWANYGLDEETYLGITESATEFPSSHSDTESPNDTSKFPPDAFTLKSDKI
jgi:hypothetical protein